MEIVNNTDTSIGRVVINAVEHPIDTITNAGAAVVGEVESLAGAAVGEVEAAGRAVVVEAESLVDKVKTFFQSTSTGHLSEALIAMATRIEALEQTVAGLGGFLK